MRLGCIGCLVIILAIVVLGVAAAGALFFSANIVADPEIRVPQITSSDGYRAQQKLYELVLRDDRRSSRIDPIVFTERELNAFLSRHLVDAADLPFSPISVVLLSDNTIEFRGRTALRNLLQGIPASLVASFIPKGRIDQPVWVRVRGEIRLERGTVRRGREYGRFDVSEFALGTQPIGAWILTVMLGQAQQHVLRWPIPSVVRSITVEEGHLVVRTAAPPS